jgi:hypothetical protein
MRCIHGFEESECPTCRIDRVSIPPISANLRKDFINNLKAENPYFKKHLALKNDFENNLMNRINFSQPTFTKSLSKPDTIFIKKIQDNALLEKLDHYNLNHLDKFNILKKVELKTPELDLEPKD